MFKILKKVLDSGKFCFQLCSKYLCAVFKMYPICLLQNQWHYYHGLPQVSFLSLSSPPVPVQSLSAPHSLSQPKTMTRSTLQVIPWLCNKKQVHSLHFPLSSVESATKASSLVVRVCKGGCFCRGSSLGFGVCWKMGHRWLTAWLTRSGQSQTGSIPPPPPRRCCVTTHFTCLLCLCSTTRLLEKTIQLTTF